MDERLGRTINGVLSWRDLDQLEINIRQRDGLSDEVQAALTARSNALGFEYVVRETGLIPGEMTPAERMIVAAIGEYAAIMKRKGRTPSRTIQQIRARGLIDAAEASVCKAKPTQGFRVLADADLEDLSYERIVLDHLDEFSPRAIWFARRTLGEENFTDRPPPPTHSDVSSRTLRMLEWLKEMAAKNNGLLPPFSNADAASAIGLGALKTYGRVQGNIQSRLDFACYLCDLPPLGCAAIAPFENAWGQDEREWAFDIAGLQSAAQTRQWESDDFALIHAAVEKLPGIAHIPWRDALRNAQEQVRAWAERWARRGRKAKGSTSDQRHLERLPAEILERATAEHVWEALQNFVVGEVEHPFGPSAEYDLVFNGQRFPPKAVFGVALSLALNGQRIEPKHFSGGEDSVCFRLLRKAGYSIVPKAQEISPTADLVEPESEWREGGRKLVPHWRRERSAGLAPAKKAEFRRVHGKLYCEQCHFDPVKTYGPDGEACIEVHHAKVRVSEMGPDHMTKLEDLQCVCANCHRLIHRKMLREADPSDFSDGAGQLETE